MEPICNDYGELDFYKESLKGVVQDYVISFNAKERDIQMIVDKTLDLIQLLFNKFRNETVRARLIAKVNFIHVNDEQQIVENRSYHFPSYHSEVVRDVNDFFIRHMMKIATRMETFHANGSNLIIDNIEHIHIALSIE